MLKPKLLAGLVNKIVTCLSTRYNQSVATVRRFLVVDDIESWGKVERLEGGDTIRASELVKGQEDGREASYVRVCVLICMQTSF